MNIKNIARKVGGTCLIAGGLLIGSAGIFLGYKTVASPAYYCSKDTLRLLNSATYAASSQSREEFPEASVKYVNMAERLMDYHNKNSKELPQKFSLLKSNLYSLAEDYDLNDHSHYLQEMIRKEASESITNFRRNIENNSFTSQLGAVVAGLILGIVGVYKGLDLIIPNDKGNKEY